MVVNLVNRHLAPLIWFDGLRMSGAVTPLILSLPALSIAEGSKEMSGANDDEFLEPLLRLVQH